MVLYGPNSQFERNIIAKYKTGQPMSVPDPNGIPEYKTPEYRRKRSRQDGETSTADSRASSRPRVVDNGWDLSYNSVEALFPSTTAAGPLTNFYKSVTESAVNQLGGAVDPLSSITFESGPFRLKMASPQPISWSFVINFAQDMSNLLSPDFAPLYSGEVVNSIWELPSVQVGLELMV